MANTISDLFPGSIKKARPQGRFPLVKGDCWLWVGRSNKQHYGSVSWGSGSWLVHRLSLFLSTGRRGLGLHGCHKCDIKSCCNPDHLFWGSDLQNQRDRLKWALVRSSDTQIRASFLLLTRDEKVDLQKLYGRIPPELWGHRPVS